jgi:hypothetical protein
MLGVFVINAAGLDEFYAVTKPSVLLYLDPGSQVQKATEYTIGRMYYDLPTQERLLADPLAGGEQLAQAEIAAARVTGIETWMGLNEPPVDNSDKITRLCALEKERTMRLNAAGLRSVVLSLSVGWPLEDMTTRKLVVDGYKPLLDWLPAQNYVGLHEYWTCAGPLSPENYDPNHPSKIWRFRYWDFDKPVLITECGVDHHGQPSDGWQSCGFSAQRYAEQLVDYAGLVCQDDRVRGLVVFQWGGGGWPSFDVSRHWREMGAAWNYTPSAPVPAQNIRVYAGGVVHTLPLEEYLRDVVPAEMPAAWPMEALRAQAIWARSYALWRIANPRHASFDLYGTTNDQVWNPQMRHSRSDLAVRETEGIWLEQDGEAFAARYVAHCGRPDCPDCQGAGGTNNETWHGRACQYGARAMANAGRTWREIATAYYPATVKLNDEQPESPSMDGGSMKIYDVLGNEKSPQWLATEWGVEVDTSLRRAGGGDNFECVELREIEGPAVYRVRVLDRDGQPWSGRFVARYYPSAPNSWPGGSKPDDIPAPPEAATRVVFGQTNTTGVCEFGLGSGDYAGPGQGVSHIWLAEHYAGTDVVRKLGMKPNTNHRTISPTFRFVPGGITPPTPTPGGSGCMVAVLEALLRAMKGA